MRIHNAIIACMTLVLVAANAWAEEAEWNVGLSQVKVRLERGANAPSPPRTLPIPIALDALTIQGVLFAVLAWVLYTTARTVYPPKRILATLAFGAAFGFVAGMFVMCFDLIGKGGTAGDLWNSLAYRRLPECINSYGALTAIAIGMAASWLSLVIFGAYSTPCREVSAPEPATIEPKKKTLAQTPENLHGEWDTGRNVGKEIV